MLYINANKDRKILWYFDFCPRRKLKIRINYCKSGMEFPKITGRKR